MKLEDEIKQKKFTSEFQKVAVNLMYTGNWVQSLNHNFLKPFDLTPQQYNILRILRGQHPNPASVNLLIDRMLDKMSNASRLVEKLRQKQLVERKECKSDRRQVDVVITKKGLNLLGQIDAEFSIMENHFKTLNASEIKELNRLLDKLRG